MKQVVAHGETGSGRLLASPRLSSILMREKSAAGRALHAVALRGGAARSARRDLRTRATASAVDALYLSSLYA